jgi:predicted transport protein
MSDLKMFRTDKNGVVEVASQSIELEKSLQTLIDTNLETMLGVRFLGSEYVTGKTHGGRIDTLGIDENFCPVIVEYKRALNENVINQGLFYLDWLLDHKAEFKLLVIDKYGRKEADEIDWTGTRLLCIAADFTRYDEHAVQQINRNIELLRYRRFGSDLLLLELVNAVTAKTSDAKLVKSEGKESVEKTWDATIADLKEHLANVFEAIRAFLLALGDDVQEKRLSLYIAFKRLKNFVCVEVRKDKVMLYLKVNPDGVQLEAGFSRDVRNIGHWGTGDLEKAKPLLIRSYADS